MALFGKLALHPIFVEDYAFFYVTDSAGDGRLKIYKYHEDIEYLEYQSTGFTFTEVSTDYLDYSMFYLGEENGVVVGIPQTGGTDVDYNRVVYDRDDGSTTTYSPTVEAGYSAEFGDDLTKLHFL